MGQLKINYVCCSFKQLNSNQLKIYKKLIKPINSGLAEDN